MKPQRGCNGDNDSGNLGHQKPEKSAGPSDSLGPPEIAGNHIGTHPGPETEPDRDEHIVEARRYSITR
jgi:hypothetical protein